MTALAILSIVMKVSVVLAAGLATLTLSRRWTPRARHAIAAATLVAALVTPILVSGLPAWRAGVTSTVLSPLSRVARVTLASLDRDVVSPPQASRTSTPRAEFRSSDIRISLGQAVVLVWAIGALTVLARLALGMRFTRATLLRSRPADGSWQQMVAGVARELGMTRRVRVVTHDSLLVPFTVGVVRPIIVLPSDASSWTPARRSAVLAHELTHVARNDCALEYVAWLACAAYWFQPLTWRVARRLRAERERSCDDAVLALGTPAPDYAEHLVELAALARESSWRAAAALAMATSANLEGRVRNILERPIGGARPSRLSRAVLSVVAAAFVLPLAAFQLSAPAITRSALISAGPDTVEIPIAANTSVQWSGPLAAGSTLSLRANMGDVMVGPSQSGLVEIVARRKAGARGAAADTRVAIVRSENGVMGCSVYVVPTRGRSDCQTDGEWGRVSIEDNAVSFDVRVPAGAHLRVQMGNGDLKVSGIRGDVHVLNGNGDVLVESDGAADITTYTGQIDFTRLSADNELPVSLHVLHGAIFATLQSGANVDARADTGAVRIRGPRVDVEERNARYTGRLLDGRAPLIARIQKGDVHIALTARR